MTISADVRERIDSIVGSDRVVLFMKGHRAQPQCGFSATTVGILDSLLPEYTTVNVLEDQDIREGIKAYSNWPTIPQLYIGKEFMGGCDVIKQMFNTGSLHEALGMETPDRTPPEISISSAAAETILNAVQSQPGAAVHLSIDALWQHNFSLGPAEGHEIKAASNGVELLMDPATATRARGMSLEMEETLEGNALSVNNPNAPPPVKQMVVSDLKARLDAQESLRLIDVREPQERERAVIAGSEPAGANELRSLEQLPKDTMLVFQCHTGQRSQAAAEHFRALGFNNVWNLVGGIDAWSREIDSSVERY